MDTVRDHRDLEAWRIAMDAVVETYQLTADFPRSETYGLTAQMRRAAVSAPSNIAEGQARPLRASLNHLSIALGSFAELDTQLEVAVRLSYLPIVKAAGLQRLIASGRRLAYGLRRAKRRRLAVSVGTPATMLLLVLHLFASAVQ